MNPEQSITKKFRAALWRPFVEAVKQYQLITEGDCIGVCISGGKDSMLLAKLMQLLARFSDFPFTLRFLVMNPGFDRVSLHKIEANLALLGIEADYFETDIFDVVSKTERSPCYLCARMRRGHLYKFAQERGCNKIALGHHLTDVAETVLMNVFHAGKFETMMPKLHSQNYPGMELIRPLYHVSENVITAWVRYHGLGFIKCGCPLAENCTITEAGGRRATTKVLLGQLKRENPDIENRILQSTHRVNLETVIGYKKCGEDFSFLDGY